MLTFIIVKRKFYLAPVHCVQSVNSEALTVQPGLNKTVLSLIDLMRTGSRDLWGITASERTIGGRRREEKEEEQKGEV